jgi:acetyl esterase/lipase
VEDESVLTRPAPGPDRTVPYGEHPDQVVDVWAGSAGRPLVLVVHGGFWRPAYDRRHTYPLANALREAGWPVASMEYRRVPGEPGRSTADVASALAAGYPVPHNGIVLAGHSAGGHLALWAAATCAPADLRAVVGLAPVADLRVADDLGAGGGAVRDFLGAPAGECPDLDPARLPTPAVPTVLVHGDRDETLPLSVSQAYAARHPDARLHVLAGATHYDLIDPLLPGWPAVVEVLEAVAQPADGNIGRA